MRSGIIFIILISKALGVFPQSDTATSSDVTKLYPNAAGKALMTPAGWSAKGNFIFGGIGGSFPQVYSKTSDLVASLGFGFGNSQKWLSIAGAATINDVSEFDAFSFSIFATHSFPKGATIGGGALHLFSDKDESDTPPSYFVRYSHTVQKAPSLSPGYSKLNYTIGVGTGRFAKNSKRDVETGKSENGTAVFGSVSYEVFKNVNTNVEWTGNNLCLTIGTRLWPSLPAISFGIADLTRFSGDRLRFVLGIGYAVYLKPKPANEN